MEVKVPDIAGFGNSCQQQLKSAVEISRVRASSALPSSPSSPCLSVSTSPLQLPTPVAELQRHLSETNSFSSGWSTGVGAATLSPQSPLVRPALWLHNSAAVAGLSLCLPQVNFQYCLCRGIANGINPSRFHMPRRKRRHPKKASRPFQMAWALKFLKKACSAHLDIDEICIGLLPIISFLGSAIFACSESIENVKKRSTSSFADLSDETCPRTTRGRCRQLLQQGVDGLLQPLKTHDEA